MTPSDDPFDDPGWEAYAKHARETLEPMVKNSAVCMSLIPDNGKVDPKIAIETGYMILLDKPIIAVVQPGTTVPPKLAKIADEIVEGDIHDPDFKDRLAAAIKRVVGATRE